MDEGKKTTQEECDAAMARLRAECELTHSVRPRGCDKAEVVQVIRTTALVGRGTSNDPPRPVTQYWDFEGNLLATNDPCEGEEFEMIRY